MNNADSILYAAQKTISEAGDKITADQKERINKGIESLKEAQKMDDLSKIKAETESLTKVVNEAATIMYQQAAQAYQQQQQQQQQQQKAKTDGSGNNVVDAEFEVKNDEKKS